MKSARARGVCPGARPGPAQPRPTDTLTPSSFVNMRFSLGGIANLIKIEQISPEVLHFWKLSFSSASSTPLSKMQNSPHETPTFAYLCNTS